MSGLERFMAPEEFVRGARIDERTNVLVLGSTALVYLCDGRLAPRMLRGSPALFEVVAKVCDPDPAHRFGSFGMFCHVWHAAQSAESLNISSS
jgi:serine/threonine-protein kinase